jgi:hypothetical protein
MGPIETGCRAHMSQSSRPLCLCFCLAFAEIGTFGTCKTRQFPTDPRTAWTVSRTRVGAGPERRPRMTRRMTQSDTPSFLKPLLGKALRARVTGMTGMTRHRRLGFPADDEDRRRSKPHHCSSCMHLRATGVRETKMTTSGSVSAHIKRPAGNPALISA